MNVQVFESHYRLGGCAHSFPITSSTTGVNYMFDAGPTIMLGCSNKPYNPLRQVLDFVGASGSVDWIPYQSWGMCTEAGNWNFELGKRGKLSSYLEVAIYSLSLLKEGS